jgi:hypothetical protein
MALTKDAVLQATNKGLDVFKHFLGSRFIMVGKSFRSPFYEDSKASCYVYCDNKSNIYKFKDFGDSEYSGDCFFMVGKIFALGCEDRAEFLRILEIIDIELHLNLEENQQKVDRLIRENNGNVTRASKITSIHDGFETATTKMPIKTKAFIEPELDFWYQYGIAQELLNRFNVISIHTFHGTNKEGKDYILLSSIQEPIFGYQGKRCTKLYMPNSNLRFLYSGEITESYVFGIDQLPVRGDILFITGGEKDVLSLVAHGFNAICLNSETAHIPKNLLRGLSYRFKHIALLYDVDETGLKSMEKLTSDLKNYSLKSLRLPLTGEKSQKDISDFFKVGHTADDLMMLFVEMLDQIYEDTLSVMRSCEIDFDRPPKAPEPVITINGVTIGSPGNLLCVSGSEGSGKTNYLGGILSGAVKPEGISIDTLGTAVRENKEQKAVLLFDTEQSEYQLYKNLTYIMKRSTLERPPAWFKAFCLVGISRNERMTLILESMDRFYYEYGGIHIMVIDGIADLLGGVNDEESSVKLIEELFRLAAIYDTCIICVLHMAPSGMKLRGHLGSEVQRKAAGIILIEKDDSNRCSVVKALKVRDGSPLDVPIIQFGWDNHEGRHVFMGEKSKEDSETRKKHDLTEVAHEIFSRKSSMTMADLTQSIMEAMDVKDRMARNYIKYMKEHSIIEKNALNSSEFILPELPF